MSNDRPHIQLIRGLPGSGKSTLAKTFDCLHLELDMYCVRGRKYRWTPDRNRVAKNLMIWRIREEMREGVDLVVCGVFPNASGTLGEIVGYALDFGYEVHIKTLTSDFGNTHAVRDCDMKGMRGAWTDDIGICDGLRERFPNCAESLAERVHYNLMPTTSENVPFREAQ